ncbi:MAG: ABC transporter permease [Lachnospiraceae bacterium]|nr:ABC transporter permease [Lachnospiraceae bacterium]
MMMFLVLKEQLKSFYGRFATFSNGAVKFVYALTGFLLLNQNLGFMTQLKSPVVPLILALASAFLPYGAISFLLALFMLAHIYTVSFEIALVTAVFLIVVALLYYGFQPGDSFWLVLTPMAFLFKIPFVIPLLAGLAGSLVTVIPVSCGIVLYYILQYVKQNAGLLTNDASVDITQKFVQVIKALVSNQAMMVMIAVAVAGVLVVYLIRMLSVDYAWILAIVLGTIVQLAAVFVGDYLFDVSVPIGELVAGAFLSVLLAGIYHFFVFAVDYSRTEYTQFEDDEYVYYVKAVPKVAVSKPDVRVQRINNPAGGRRARR